MKYLGLVLLLLVGCSQGQKIYDNPNAVSIYLKEEPELTDNSYIIKFRFEHNHPDATHVIQKIEWAHSNHIGLESFKTCNGKMFRWYSDVHSREQVVQEKRTMTIMTGSVTGADEAASGFAMLPSNWPSRFNENYLKNHKIQGHIEDINPETTTTYTIEFDRGTLTFEVEGKVKYVWSIVTADAK